MTLTLQSRDVAIPRSNPHPSQNLITLYKLDEIAKSVERKDPVTGVKTNKLRKSYENQIKTLGIAGRNKAVDGQSDFENLMIWPDDDYQAKRVLAKSIENGLRPDFDARLQRALHIPVYQQRLTDQESDRWRTLIGTEEPVKIVRPPGQPAPAHEVQPNGIVKPAAPGAVRPERSGTKRRYDDSSYVGYGEGYLDDHEDDSDDNKALARRKRAKQL